MVMTNSQLQLPEDVRISLDDLIIRFTSHFDEDLVGIYLHGSLAMGCFNPESSDIDILIVVTGSITLESKKDLSTIMLELSKNAPAKGYELSVVSLNDLKNFAYPTPYQFHFGADQVQTFADGNADLSDGKTDPDLAAHFVITKKRGICLFGQPTSEIFPDVPNKHYLDSISRDATWSYERIMEGPNSGTVNVPDYGVLNFCRVLAFIKDGIITSKPEGGLWALENMPDKYVPVIKEALKEKTRCGTAEKVEASLLKEFAEYPMKMIKNRKLEDGFK